ncbi:hypothetical protein Tco_0589868 [Tanacetum coccineum]
MILWPRRSYLWRKTGGPKDFGSRETCYSPKEIGFTAKWGALRATHLKSVMIQSGWSSGIPEDVGIDRSKKVRGRIARAFTDAQGTMGECFHGLYHMLAKSEGGGSIIVVVDRFSKYGTFIAAPPDVTADDTAKLFFKNVAAKKMKKWADERRRHFEFEVGDQQMVKLLPQQFKSLRKVHKELIQRYEGPFPMIGRVGKVSYQVQPPPKLKIHPVFHVSFLKPSHGDEEDPEASWEAEDLLWQLRDRVKEYHEDGRRGVRELRWGRMSRPAWFYEVTRDSGLFYT